MDQLKREIEKNFAGDFCANPESVERLIELIKNKIPNFQDNKENIIVLLKGLNIYFCSVCRQVVANRILKEFGEE